MKNSRTQKHKDAKAQRHKDRKTRLTGRERGERERERVRE